MSDQQSQQRTPEEIRSDIEETREELADTAAALAYKADVKSRASERVQEVKSDVRAKVAGVKSNVTGKVDAAKEKAPDSSGGPAKVVGNAASSAQQTVKANPIPAAAIAAAVVGFAIGYLVANRN